MKLLTTILLTSVLFGIAGCSSNSTEPTSGIPSPAMHVNLSFVDENGNDRLDPNHENALNEQNLDIYYRIDGEKINVFDPNLDHPKQFKIFYAMDQEKYAMTLWLSTHINDGYTTTYIEFPGGTTDTLKLKAKKYEKTGIVRGNKIWYDDELVWELAEKPPSDPTYFVVTKTGN